MARRKANRDLGYHLSDRHELSMIEFGNSNELVSKQVPTINIIKWKNNLDHDKLCLTKTAN